MSHVPSQHSRAREAAREITSVAAPDYAALNTSTEDVMAMAFALTDLFEQLQAWESGRFPTSVEKSLAAERDGLKEQLESLRQVVRDYIELKSEQGWADEGPLYEVLGLDDGSIPAKSPQ